MDLTWNGQNTTDEKWPKLAKEDIMVMNFIDYKKSALRPAVDVFFIYIDFNIFTSAGKTYSFITCSDPMLSCNP